MVPDPERSLLHFCERSSRRHYPEGPLHTNAPHANARSTSFRPRYKSLFSSTRHNSASRHALVPMSAVVDAVFGSYDLKNAKQWRDEDLLYREQEKQWREDAIRRECEWRCADLVRERRVLKLENEKRIIDARHRQLVSVSQMSALLAGFTMSTIVEVQIADATSEPVIVAYGAVCCMEVRDVGADAYTVLMEERVL